MRKKLARALRSVFWVGFVAALASLLFLGFFHHFSAVPIFETGCLLALCALVQVAAYIGGTRFSHRAWWPGGLALPCCFAVLYAGAAGPAVLYGFSSGVLSWGFWAAPPSPLTYALLPFFLIAALAALGYALIGLLWLYCDLRRALGRPLAEDAAGDVPEEDAVGGPAVLAAGGSTLVMRIARRLIGENGPGEGPGGEAVTTEGKAEEAKEKPAGKGRKRKRKPAKEAAVPPDAPSDVPVESETSGAEEKAKDTKEKPAGKSRKRKRKPAKEAVVPPEIPPEALPGARPESQTGGTEKTAEETEAEPMEEAAAPPETPPEVTNDVSVESETVDTVGKAEDTKEEPAGEVAAPPETSLETSPEALPDVPAESQTGGTEETAEGTEEKPTEDAAAPPETLSDMPEESEPSGTEKTAEDTEAESMEEVAAPPETSLETSPEAPTASNTSGPAGKRKKRKKETDDRKKS